ncbi:MAG: 2-oxoglutarate dehydrogenase E1 subunit family protein, partial [Phycisphaerae bacterium]
ERISAQNLEFAESQFANYLNDRNSVSPDWRDYFDELQAGQDGNPISVETFQNPFQFASVFHRGAGSKADGSTSEAVVLQERLDQLIRSYRVRGHIVAQIDPLQST